MSAGAAAQIILRWAGGPTVPVLVGGVVRAGPSQIISCSSLLIERFTDGPMSARRRLGYPATSRAQWRLQKALNGGVKSRVSSTIKGGVWGAGLSSLTWGGIVMDSHAYVESPTCPKCGVEMQLYRSDLVKFVPAVDLHLFKCPTCLLFAESEMVREPVWVPPDHHVSYVRFFSAHGLTA